MGGDYYARECKDVLSELNVSESGLSAAEAKQRLAANGRNVLQERSHVSAIRLLIAQFSDAMMLLLFISGLLSLIAGEYVEATAIAVIMLLNAILGFIQEYRAEKSMEALARMSAPIARVLRDGQQMRIPAAELVPGDIIILEAGDIVPADARIITSSNFQIDESALTGESVPSEKGPATLKAGLTVADQKNMVFMSTPATVGDCTAVVTATAKHTEFGKIASSIQEMKDTETPLQRKFRELVRQIGIIVIALVAFSLILGFLGGKPFLGHEGLLLFALAVMISVIPDSLPAIVTISLSMGAAKLARRNMLVKKLSAAESLGSTTVICTDKTGTLTQNQMTVTTLYVNGGRVAVSGAGYEPVGVFAADGKPYDARQAEMLFRIGYLCNKSKLALRKEQDTHNGKYEVLGDPTEGSLLVLGRKAQFDDDAAAGFPIIAEIPFDSDRKLMSVIAQDGNKRFAYTKGAPDLLLARCDRILENGKVRKLTAEDRKTILAANEGFAKEALRVLGFAYAEAGKQDKYTSETTERDLIFVGLVGMIDPPRPEVKDAIAKCDTAGIKVIMITGDHPVTAKAIAQQIGLWHEGDELITGAELERISDDELQSRIERVRIVARAMPIQKVRIVGALKHHGHIVAMTGDGVNDAPALKAADIGIAMGSGTDVAREVAKATLVDDNFSSIVNAVEQGRNIYDKMLRSAWFLLSCNAGEITAVLIAAAFSLPLPMLPLQLLLMNILTDNFPALGLGAEPDDAGVMGRPPRDPREKPITSRMFLSILVLGLIMGGAAMIVFLKYKDISLAHAQTMAFTTLVVVQMFAVVSARSMVPSLKRLNPFTNLWLLGAIGLSVGIQCLVVYVPFLQEIFGTVALSALDWLEILGFAIISMIAMEIAKYALYRMVERKKAEEKVVVASPSSA